MQLRDHPLIIFRDLSSWPLAWVRLGSARAKAAKKLTGEIGILKEVRYYTHRRGRIYLTTDYAGTLYVGCLVFDNHSFCEKAFEHLRRCYGMNIEAIGSSELP
jgi:hypothetical protein